MTYAELVLQRLAGSPGLTSRELQHALGVASPVMWSLLRRMEARADLVSRIESRPGQGPGLTVWSIAPPGTVPPPPPDLPPEIVERRRQVARDAQRRTRARAKGPVIPPGGQIVAPVPHGGTCAEADPALFFPPRNESPYARDTRVAQALMICGVCPVRPQCYAAALANGESWGVWGGVDFEVMAKAAEAS
jgi:hypothetical protein